MAETELREAVAYYEDRRLGLGFDFAREVEASVESVCHFPERWPVRNDATRRYLVQRIPAHQRRSLPERPRPGHRRDPLPMPARPAIRQTC